MRYQTELTRTILTDETAQEIIDWVSRLYGDSYVGLWIYQVMGTVLGEARAMAEQLRQEVQPSTAEYLLDLWEESCGLTVERDLTPAQRRVRLWERKSHRTAVNPVRLERLVEAMTGCRARVTENTAPYTFTLEVESEDPAAIDTRTLTERLRRVKPAHQQMELYLGSGGLAEGYMATAVIGVEMTDAAEAEKEE